VTTLTELALFCHRAMKTLADAVVESPAAAIHTHGDLPLDQWRQKQPAGKLRPLIGVEDLRLGFAR
jgi:hypothetical protein